MEDQSIPIVKEKLNFTGGLPSTHPDSSLYAKRANNVRRRNGKKSAPKQNRQSVVEVELNPIDSVPLISENSAATQREQLLANEAVKALDDLIRAEIASAKKLYGWKNLSAPEKVLFILDILVRAGIISFMGTFTGLLYMDTGTTAGLTMELEFNLALVWAKILEIIADIEGVSANAILNSEGGIDFKKTIEERITKIAAKTCKSCVSDATLKKLGLLDTISFNPDETVREKRIRVAKAFGRVTGKVAFTVTSAAVYYFLAKKYGIPTFVTGAAANGLGVSSLTWLNPTLPTAQQAVIDYLKRNELEPLLNLMEVDPEEGMKRLRRLDEYADLFPENSEAHAQFRLNLDLLYLALTLTSATPLTEDAKEFLEKTQPTPQRRAFAKIIYGISVGSIGGYIYDVSYGVYHYFESLAVKIITGLSAAAIAFPPFFGLSTGAANRVGAELFSDQSTLASLIKTSFLKYTRYTLIASGYALTAGSGFTNWMLNLIFANEVISWLSTNAVECFNKTAVNATELFSTYTAPLLTSTVQGSLANVMYPSVRDEMARAAPIIFQNLTAGEVCEDQRSWFGMFVANVYAMVGMIGAPVTNLFYWLLMTDNLTVYLAEHGCTDQETQEMIAHVKMFRNIVSGLENTDPIQFARMLNKIFTPIEVNAEGEKIYSHLAKQLFAILDVKLSAEDKLELDETLKKSAMAPDIWNGAEKVWDTLRQEGSLTTYKTVKEKEFLEDAKTHVTTEKVHIEPPASSKPNRSCCTGRNPFTMFNNWRNGRGEYARLVPEGAEINRTFEV